MIRFRADAGTFRWRISAVITLMAVLISGMWTYAYLAAPSPVLIIGIVPYSVIAIMAYGRLLRSLNLAQARMALKPFLPATGCAVAALMFYLMRLR